MQILDSQWTKGSEDNIKLVKEFFRRGGLKAKVELMYWICFSKSKSNLILY